jgi:hypothetical protein
LLSAATGVTKDAGVKEVTGLTEEDHTRKNVSSIFDSDNTGSLVVEERGPKFSRDSSKNFSIYSRKI